MYIAESDTGEVVVFRSHDSPPGGGRRIQMLVQQSMEDSELVVNLMFTYLEANDLMRALEQALQA